MKCPALLADDDSYAFDRDRDDYSAIGGMQGLELGRMRVGGGAEFGRALGGLWSCRGLEVRTVCLAFTRLGRHATD